MTLQEPLGFWHSTPYPVRSLEHPSLLSRDRVTQEEELKSRERTTSPWGMKHKKPPLCKTSSRRCCEQKNEEARQPVITLLCDFCNQHVKLGFAPKPLDLSVTLVNHKAWLGEGIKRGWIFRDRHDSLSERTRHFEGPSWVPRFQRWWKCGERGCNKLICESLPLITMLCWQRRCFMHWSIIQVAQL